MPKGTKFSFVDKNVLLALRNADFITFNNIERKKSKIICTKEVDGRKLNYEFDVNSDLEIPNLIPEFLKLTKIVYAKYIALYVPYDWEIQSVFGLLQLNDELELIWQPDVLSDPKNDSHLDALKLIIYRKEQRFHFKLGFFLSNSKDRMIKINNE